MQNGACSLLLTASLITSSSLLTGNDLAQHDNTITIHEGDTRETFTVLESICDQRLLWLERAFSHLVGLQRVRVFQLLSTCLLAHLPLQGTDTAGSATTAHKADRGVANLDLIRDIEHLDLGSKFLGLAEGRVLLVDHDITRARHVVLIETLDIQANVVTWLSKVDTLVVHLDSEHLAGARIGWSVCWQEDHLFVRLHNTLLDTACENITDTLDLVDSRDWHAHRGTGWTLWNSEEVVEAIQESIDVDDFLVNWNIHALPPAHVVGLLEEIITHPPRDWNDRGILLDKVLLPANLDECALHLIHDLVIACLLISCSVAVHLVDSNANLLHTQQVDQARVLAGLALDLTCLVVALGDGSGKVTISWNHDEGAVSLGGTGDHVLDEVAVTWSINDGVVPLLGVELLGSAGNGDTTLTLLLLTIHVERESEGALAKTLGLLLQLLELTLREATKLKDEAASGGTFSTIDVAADDNGKVLLLRVGNHFDRSGSF